MPDFDQIQFNTRAFSELTTLLKTKKIPNALLFYGKENTRKKEAAFFFAKGTNCLQSDATPCNQCRSCIKIESHHHPDIHTIAVIKGKKNITISQIRELNLAVSSKPNEAKIRVVMIVDADLMNTQAQNALLKLLEEPPDKTIFILLAQKESLLLATIQSRSRKIRFTPMTEKMVALHLTQSHGVESEMADIISKTADGDLKKALRYLNLDEQNTGTDWIKRRQWLLTNLSKLVNQGQMNITSALSISRKLSASPDLMDDTLGIIQTFFRDLIVFKWSPKKIINLDFFDVYAEINQQVVPDVFPQWLTTFYETEKRLQSNSSLRLSLDRFFLKLAFNKGN